MGGLTDTWMGVHLHRRLGGGSRFASTARKAEDKEVPTHWIATAIFLRNAQLSL